MRSALAAAPKAARLPVRIAARLFSAAVTDGHGEYKVTQVIYETNGAPAETLRVTQGVVSNPAASLGPNQVFLRQLAAPLNPADFNLVEGTYGVKASLPAIGGNEGLFRVEAASPTSALKAGDWVIPIVPNFGTWRSHAVADDFAFMKVPQTVSEVDAATVSVNPCTAFRMLSDFVALKPGDVILQNGATSGVGKAVIQIAKARGVKTINIVRDRPDFAQTRLELMCLGADVVVTEAALRNRTEMAAALSAAGCDESKPRLALNCVGGTLVGDMIRHMGHAASVVTYGGMSKKPISVGTGPFIFNDLSLRGFWMTKWNAEHGPDSPERLGMLKALFGMMEKGQLKTETETVEIRSQADIVKAVEMAGASHKKSKVIVTFPDQA